MTTVFDDSHKYLNSSIRTYVNATSTLDKFFAIKLVVLSMIVAADALIEKTGSLDSTPFQSHIEESSLFLPVMAYEQRILELQQREEENSIPPQLELSRRLRKALDILRVIHGKYSLKSLLAVNIKEFINESLYFIFDIQELVEKN